MSQNDDIKLVHQALGEIKSMVTEKTKDIVTEEKFNKVSNDLILLQEKAQKAEQEATALKATIQALGVQDGKADNAIEKKEHEAMRCFLKSGSDLEIKALGAYSQQDGGLTVPTLISAQIIKNVYETSPIRSIASVENTSSDRLEFVIDDGEFSSGWASETDSRTETNTANLAKKTIAVFEQYAEPRATQQILDDSIFNLEGWISEKVSDKFARQENSAFVNGNGVAKPKGFLDYPAGTNFRTQIEQINLGSSSGLTGNGIIALQNSLKEPYQKNASWVMKRSTYGALLALMYTDNKFDALNPSSVNGNELFLLGNKIILADDMPAIASNALPVAYGDFSLGYKILDRVGITLIRDALTLKPFVKFYFTKRVGGDVLNNEAIKIGKIAS